MFVGSRRLRMGSAFYKPGQNKLVGVDRSRSESYQIGQLGHQSGLKGEEDRIYQWFGRVQGSAHAGRHAEEREQEGTDG